MNPAQYWNDWFEGNCADHAETFKAKYSEAFMLKGVINIADLKTKLELNDNYLVILGVDRQDIPLIKVLYSLEGCERCEIHFLRRNVLPSVLKIKQLVM